MDYLFETPNWNLKSEAGPFLENANSSQGFDYSQELGRKIDSMESATMQDSKRFSKQFGRCWRHRFPGKKLSHSTPRLHRRQEPLGLFEANVSGRKQVIYRDWTLAGQLEQAGKLGYTFMVVDSQKTPTNRHVHHGIQTSQLSFAPEARGL